MSLVAVTSFSQSGWNEYAKEGVESFCKYWPGKVIAYFEDDPPDYEHEKLIYRNLYEQPDLAKVLAWCKKNPVLQGEMPGGHYNYHFNIYKFVRHVFAISHSALRDERYVFWLDADVRIQKEVPVKFLEDMFKDDVYTVHLGRNKTHTESGFQGFDTSNLVNNRFMMMWKDMYLNGAVLALPYGWHDCWSYDYLLRTVFPKTNNLTPEINGSGPTFSRSPLAEYMIHLKGAWKHAKAS